MLNGEVWIVDPSTTDCFLVYNNRPNLPNSLQDSSFRTVALPNKSSFGTIEPIAVQDAFYMLYGEGLYLKNQLDNNDCSDIDDNGSYRNVLGTFPNGNQAYYAGHAELDENTLENPIADGGAAMMNVNITGYYDYISDPSCPIPLKSFLNGKLPMLQVNMLPVFICNISHASNIVDSCYLSARSTNACTSSWTESEDDNRAVVCGSPGEVANDPLKPNTFVFPYQQNVESPQTQKKDVWNMIALNNQDQLRQRMAWALSQILVVTPKQVQYACFFNFDYSSLESLSLLILNFDNRSTTSNIPKST